MVEEALFSFGLEGFMVKVRILGFWDRLQPPPWPSFLISHFLLRIGRSIHKTEFCPDCRPVSDFGLACGNGVSTCDALKRALGNETGI